MILIAAIFAAGFLIRPAMRWAFTSGSTWFYGLIFACLFTIVIFIPAIAIAIIYKPASHGIAQAIALLGGAATNRLVDVLRGH